MPAPNTLAKLDRLLLVADPASCEPGAVTCSAWEMISVKPSSVNSVPSVVMNELIPTIIVIRPLTRPIAVHATKLISTATSSGTWPFASS